MPGGSRVSISRTCCFALWIGTLILPLNVLGYQWPSPLYDALETILYEGRRSDGSNLASIQHPCKNRGSTPASIGAEWLRLAYHDVATHDSQKGTGGLDASIAFELDRTENGGIGMHRSLQDFSTFPSKYISRADVIAIGTTFAVASCGGPVIPFRGGRIDALVADSMGVPEASQDFATHTAIFQRQGFSQEEMIGLVACGHTLGGVRSSDFPALVAPGADPSVDNFKVFDSTKSFDNEVVVKYLDGTTLNPLVVDQNSTMTSDSRIFSSDGGATMRRLASPEEFSKSCASLLERMLNTVPANVTLTDEIVLLPAKVSAAQLTVEHEALVFKTSLRSTQPINTTISTKRTVKLFWCDRSGPTQRCSDGHAKSSVAASSSVDEPQISPMTMRAGYYFAHYNFVVPVDPAQSISTFWFEVDDNDGSKARTYDNDGRRYELVQDEILYVPTSSSVSFGGFKRTLKTFHIVAAVKNTSSPTRVYMSVFDSAMTNYTTPLNEDIEMKLNSTIPTAAGYVFYSGFVDDVGSQLTVDLHVNMDGVTYTEDYMQTYFLATSIPYTPPTTVEIVAAPTPSKSSSSPRTRGLVHIDNVTILLIIALWTFWL